VTLLPAKTPTTKNLKTVFNVDLLRDPIFSSASLRKLILTPSLTAATQGRGKKKVKQR